MIEPAERATVDCNMSCRPLRGLVSRLKLFPWGLRPRLYAVARFAGYHAAAAAAMKAPEELRGW